MSIEFAVIYCILLQETSKDSYLQPIEEADGHELAGGQLMMSPHNKWLATFSPDGKLAVRLANGLVSISDHCTTTTNNNNNNNSSSSNNYHHYHYNNNSSND